MIDVYQGFKEVTLTNDQLAAFYQGDISLADNLLTNEYLLIRDTDNNIIDKYKCFEGKLQQINYNSINSKQLGKLRPKDVYQELAIDSLYNNQLTMLRGPAGSGKSLIALSYLFQCLEKDKISRIIIFCNTVATAGAAKLGYYPGDREAKILDSQVGNFLASKLGSSTEVLRLVDDEKLLLLPMADIRGYDTSGLNAGIYIQECQNMSVELLKLGLQRIGEDSICILDGDDDAQVDMKIYEGVNNGMKRASKIFRGDYCYGEVKLQNIYRSHIAVVANNM